MSHEKRVTDSPLNNTYSRVDSKGHGNLLYIDEIWYSSIIQYYYANKYCYDPKEVEQIMGIHDARHLIKKYKQRRLHPVKYQEWKIINKIILTRGMYSKFEQNIAILKDLLSATKEDLKNIKEGVYIDTEKSIFISFEMDSFSCLDRIQNTYNNDLPVTLKNPGSIMKPYLKNKFEEYRTWQVMFNK